MGCQAHFRRRWVAKLTLGGDSYAHVSILKAVLI
jgi:hypothetical protein